MLELDARQAGTWGRWLGGAILHHRIRPAVVHLLGDVKVPVNGKKERHFVLIYFLGVEPRNLAPSAGRVVSILKILGRQNESCQEHPAATL